ncbi:hypothetical protein GCM10023221_12310 [Luteimicrobium xylanilyticum]|uniref:Mucin-2 n=1 Tax=Luteimicrobium xylanilyticum TaxID=1133546 RepID=A0A5P9QFR8_9MICO|nr:collagen-binding domain-containing protein [Luteimicrobium xylanilyticum]QFU99295.1 Mucin-2 [Luteimicrobium xylanilyticum]
MKNHPAHTTPHGPRRVLAIVGAGALVLGASTLVGTGLAGDANAAESTVCTGYDTDGFTIFVQHDVTLGNDETEGSLALGGDLRLTKGTNLLHSTGLTPAGYSLPVVDGDPTRLLVGGTLDLTSQGDLQVTSAGRSDASQLGAIKFGDTAGLELTSRDGVDRLHEAGGSIDADPYVDVNDAADQTFDGDHAVTYAGSADVVTSRFPRLVAQGESLRTASGDGVAQATVHANGSDGSLSLTAGKLNVLTIDASTLGAFTALTFAGVTPGDGTELVVNVTGTGGTVRVPPLRGADMPGQPDATHPNPWAPYVTWNLTGAGTTTVTGDLVTGTILAPDVDLTVDANSPVEGQIVAKSLVTRGGEIHQYLAASSCTTPPPTPTETTTTPAPTPTDTTPAPTPTDTTPAPTPSGTTTTPAQPTTTPAPSSTTTSPAPVAPVTSSTPTTEVLATGGTAPSSGGSLATTGASVVGPLVAGAALVVGGLVLLLVRRRSARG